MAQLTENYRSGFITNIFKEDRVNQQLIGDGGSWIGSLASAVMDLHDGVERYNHSRDSLPDTDTPPKILFVTATSAVPHAYAIKSCWQNAYPNEPVPKIHFIDVSMKRFNSRPDEDLEKILSDRKIVNSAVVERLRYLGELHDAFTNVAVFDEYRHRGVTLGKVEKLLEEAGFSDINCISGAWGNVFTQKLPNTERPLFRQENPSIGPLGVAYRRLEFNISQNSRPLIDDMREIGRRMAGEIAKHYE